MFVISVPVIKLSPFLEYCQVRKMACVENIAPVNVDSEMEEGEIVDDLSDISSEEEFLLRQRLEVLENYNNVLERKKAKRSSIGAGRVVFIVSSCIFIPNYPNFTFTLAHCGFKSDFHDLA